MPTLFAWLGNSDLRASEDASGTDFAPILMALEQDGEPLRLRDRGPLWVILPSDQYPELAADTQNFKSIWQLKSLDVQ